jgi:hypothetical protein
MIRIKPAHLWFEDWELIVEDDNTRVFVKSGSVISRHKDSENPTLINKVDMELCFSILSTEESCFLRTKEQKIPLNVATSILDTKLPKDTKVLEKRVGSICTGFMEMLEETDEVEGCFQTYHDVFHVMGADDEESLIKLRDSEGNVVKTCPGYPDMVTLDFNVDRNNVVTFGYYR